MKNIKDDMLERIEARYTELIDVIQELQTEATFDNDSPDQWSVTDHLTHVTVWEEVLLRFHLGGEKFDQVVGLEGARYRQTPFDEINEIIHKRYRDRSSPEVMEFAQQTHTKLMEKLKQLSQEELEAPAAALQQQGYRAKKLVHYIAAITYEHYSEHLQVLEKVGD